MKYTIYSLADPRTFHIRYIGITKAPLSIRLNWHMTDRPSDKSHRKMWIRSLRREGLAPIIAVLGEYLCDRPTASNTEIAWIKAGRESLDLVNHDDGGCLGMTRSVTWGAKIAAAKIGRPRRSPSLESIERVAAWHRGKKRSLESRARMSAAQKANPENIQRLRDRNISMRGGVYTPERRARMAEIMKKIRAERPWSTRGNLSDPT